MNQSEPRPEPKETESNGTVHRDVPNDVFSAAGAQHFDRSTPFEWKCYEIAGEFILVRDVPEAGVACYTFKSTTRNPRVIAQAEAVLYEGKVVEPFFEEDVKLLTLGHSWVGRVETLVLHEWLDDPVPVLEPCSSISLPERGEE